MDTTQMLHYESTKKSVGLAYVLWFFFGMLGVHRFYLGYTGSGAAIMGITLLSAVLSFVLIGWLTIWISGLWVLVDLFLIPGLASRQNSRLLSALGHREIA